MRRPLGIAALVLASAGAGVFWLQHTPTPERTPAAPAHDIPVERSAAAPADRVEPDRPRIEFAEPTGDEAESARRAAFHERARSFFAQAPALNLEERREQARSIEAEIDEHEASLALSAGEALLLRAALIRETVEDPVQQQLKLDELTERYRQAAERRAAVSPGPDTAFELYKVREAEIVAQVAAMKEIPAGLSRDEYLRQRLQSEREVLLGDR